MRHVVAVVLCAVVACKPGPVSAQDHKTAQGGESPQEVFDKAKAAGLKKDWKTLFTLLAPEERDEFIMFMIVGVGFGIVQEKEAKKEHADEHETEAKELMKKYGLDKDQGQEGDIPLEDKEKFRKHAHECLKDVKDKPALVGEIMALLQKIDDKKDMDPPFAKEKASLKDVKVAGDKATGTIDSGDGKTQKQVFVKVEGRWYMSMYEDKKAEQDDRLAEEELQAGFAAAQAYVENKDWKRFYSILNPADHDMALGEALAAAQFASGSPSPKEVTALLEKHGLKDVKISDIPFDRWEEGRKKAKEVFKGVKDRPGLFEGLMKFAVDHDTQGSHIGELKGTLEKVKIEGNKATGTLKSEKEKSRGLRFVKRKDRWYVDQWYPIP